MKITETFSDGTVIERDATKEEIEQRAKDLAELQEQEQKKIEKIIQRQALLDKLGITEEEARLLLGGN